MRRTNVINILLILVAPVLMLASCTSATAYSTQLKNEKKLIADYIKRNHITIIYEEPAYDQWKENEYLELDDYCYFHLTQMGDTTTDSLEVGQTALIRYRRYTLNANPDTVSYWTSNDSSSPIEIQFGTGSSASCTAWELALLQMRYTGAQGKLICPSKLGFNADATSVTPYGYDLKLKIRNF